MRLVLAFFDTLNRRSLECYGGNFVKTPNFNRLAEKSITFDNHFAGSLPCMPARREIMTGRYNFLHRSWGPLEPFDNALPEILYEEANIYSHLITDHSHYWKDGGATYHSRYDSFEFVRGQEMDPWKGYVNPPTKEWENKFHQGQFDLSARSKFRRNLVNRNFIKNYEDFPSVETMNLGLEFIELNKNDDDWFLQIECFDPHEPFEAPERFKKGYPTNYTGPILDYPPYGKFYGSEDEAEELRSAYAATLSHSDFQLGRLLDVFDENEMWENTSLIVTTDHGFLLGEHDLWAKNVMPVFNEVAKIPLFISTPNTLEKKGQKRKSLTQTIDLMPTILGLFGLNSPKETHGQNLMSIIKKDNNLRRFILYGYHGAAINITDGRYTYFKYPENIYDGNLFQYTLMPSHIMSMFSVQELRLAELRRPFNFTKGVPLLKIPVIPDSAHFKRHGPGSLLPADSMMFDIEKDENQLLPIKNQKLEKTFQKEIVNLMKKNDAPSELYQRFNLTHLT